MPTQVIEPGHTTAPVKDCSRKDIKQKMFEAKDLNWLLSAASD